MWTSQDLLTIAFNAYEIFWKCVSQINEQILKFRRYGSNLITKLENPYRHGFHAPTLYRSLYISKNVMQNEWLAINKLVFQ